MDGLHYLLLILLGCAAFMAVVIFDRLREQRRKCSSLEHRMATESSQHRHDLEKALESTRHVASKYDTAVIEDVNHYLQLIIDRNKASIEELKGREKKE